MIHAVMAFAAIVSDPQGARQSTLQIGAARVTVPLPAGFCRPSGSEVARFQRLAAPDDKNVTLLSLTECRKTKSNRYLLVKAPVFALDEPVSRSELLKGLGDAMEAPEVPADLELMKDQVARKKSIASGEDVELDGTYRPRGRDDTCVYAGGVMTYTTAATSRVQAIASCMTAAGGRMLTLHAYQDDGDATGYRQLFPLLKRWALGMR